MSASSFFSERQLFVIFHISYLVGGLAASLSLIASFPAEPYRLASSRWAWKPTRIGATIQIGNSLLLFYRKDTTFSNLFGDDETFFSHFVPGFDHGVDRDLFVFTVLVHFITEFLTEIIDVSFDITSVTRHDLE